MKNSLSSFLFVFSFAVVATMILLVLEQNQINVKFGHLLTLIFTIINIAALFVYFESQKREAKEGVVVLFIMIGAKLLLYLITIASLFAIERKFTLEFVIYFFSLYLGFTILDVWVMLKDQKNNKDK